MYTFIRDLHLHISISCNNFILKKKQFKTRLKVPPALIYLIDLVSVNYIHYNVIQMQHFVPFNIIKDSSKLNLLILSHVIYFVRR